MGIPLDEDLFDTRRPFNFWLFAKKVIWNFKNLNTIMDNNFNDIYGQLANIEDELSEGGITQIVMNNTEVPVVDNVADLGTVVTDVSGKQDTLVSGSNIKTINSQSILGNGNLNIAGGISNIEMNGSNVNINNGTAELGTVITDVSGKQDTLVSGTNIKTINNTSILGSGNIDTPIGITGITMNSTNVSVNNGTADLGTVITDVSGKQDTLVSGVNIKTINNESILGNGNISISGGSSAKIFYGTSSTAAGTQEKVVVCPSFTSSDLADGTLLFVYFNNAHTFNGAPKLNVNSTGAIFVRRIGSTNMARYEWQAGELLTFVYSGSNWYGVDAGLATTTYYGYTKLSSSTSSTSTSLAATPSAVKAAYDLANGKQDALVSGTNIKTVKNQSILGSGDISIDEPTFGISNGWNYILYPNNYIHAWRDYSVDTYTTGLFANTVNLPFTMATTDYTITVNLGSWKITRAWSITYDRTTTQGKIAYYVNDTDSRQYEDMNLTLDGYIDS